MSGIMISTFNGNGTGGGGGGGTTYSVTVGTNSPDYGFISGTFGSISPVTLSGVNINSLFVYYVYNGGPNRLYITLGGSVAQGVFTNLVVGGISYTSVSATYYVAGGDTIWTWPITTNPFATIGSVVPVTIT